MKKKEISISIGIILMIIFVITIAIVIINMVSDSKDNTNLLNEETLADLSDEDIVRFNENFYENGWSKKLIDNITEEGVPIPSGFNYISGSKDTGVIVEDGENNKFMWVPYDENNNIINVDEYYFTCEYDEFEYTSYENMKKYGGFYVLLSEEPELENLNSLGEEDYITKKQDAEKLCEQNEKISSHIIYKEELAQLLGFQEKSNNNLIGKNNEQNSVMKLSNNIVESNMQNMYATTTVLTISSTARLSGYYAQDNPDEYSVNEDENNVNIYETKMIIETPSGNKLKVPVPVGFDAAVNNNVVTITDQANKELEFVWIPVNEEYNNLINDDLKNNISELVEDESQKEAILNSRDPQTEEYNSVIESINMYGGFYMGKAEFGFDDEGCEYNLPRTMKDDYASIGDYFRSVPTYIIEQYNKSNYPSYLEQQEDGSYVLTYEKAVELSEDSLPESNTVIPHLTFGAEWNAAIMYLMNANVINEDSVNKVINDSTEISGSKYINSEYKDKLAEIDTIAGLWGIAGNLSDITQEEYIQNGQTYNIARGGNYGTTGQEASIASIQLINDEDLQNQQFGFRQCLILPVTTDTAYYREHDEQEISLVGTFEQLSKNNINQTTTEFLKEACWVDWNSENQEPNDGFLFVADTIHNFVRVNGYSYNENVIKYVPGLVANNQSTARLVDCSHYVSWVLYEYGYTELAGKQQTTWTIPGLSFLKNVSGNYSLQRGDIVLTTSSHVQIYNGCGTWQNCGTNDAIKCTWPYYKDYSGFYANYRVVQASGRNQSHGNIYNYMNKEYKGYTRGGFIKYP